MNCYNDNIKRLISIFFLIIFFASFLLISVLAQELDKKKEKQLKIFQLSQLLEKENKFPRQNAYFNNALAYLNHEHFAMAIQELEKIEYNNLYIPLYLKSQLLKGQCYEKLQRWDSALYIYQNLNENIPLMQDYSAYFLSKVYLGMSDIRNALKSFQMVVNEYPNSLLVPLARYQLAQIYLQEGQLDYFLEECNMAIEIANEGQFKARVLTRMSDVLWEEEKVLDSLLYLKDLLENHYNRERIASYENLYVKRFRTAKENKKVEMPANLSLFCAGIFFNYRQYEVAETLYDEVIKLYPDQVDLAQVYYNKARAIHYQGQYERAIEECNYILETFKVQEDIIIRTLYLYAGALLSSGNRNRAVEKYEEIIAKYPESYFAKSSYLRLSEIEFLQDREDYGIKLLNRLIAEYPQSSQAREASWKLARHYTNKDRIGDALEYYRLIYNRFPESSQGDDALYWLGKLQSSIDKEEGFRLYRNLLEKYPDSYYAFHIPREAKKDNLLLEHIISHSKDISVEQFKNEYFPKNNQAQLSTYQAELLKDIGIYHESVLEIINALNQESGNVYLMYLLTEAYHQGAEYYHAIGWAQTLFNHFLNSNQVEQIPFQVWEYVFPIHYASMINSRAFDYNLDPFLILSTIREESHFNVYSESRAGARGLMQIILSTGEWIAQKVNYQDFNDDYLFDPDVNIYFGCWYLNYLQKKYNHNYYLMISGYNAGPGVTDRWIESFDVSDIDSFVENIPYQESTEHIKKVMRSYMLYKIIYNNK